MQENDLQEILDKLGNRVSLLSEENRKSKMRDEAGREIFSLLTNCISPQELINLYNSIKDPFVKDLMYEWGKNLFPNTK